jgi:hypothetical protein
MRRRLCILVVCCLAVAVSVAAAPPKDFKAEVQTAGSTLALSIPIRGVVSASLVVAGPNDFHFEKTFMGGGPVAVNLSQLQDREGNSLVAQDGNYSWELRVQTASPEAAVPGAAARLNLATEPGPNRMEAWVSSGRFRFESGGITPVEGPLQVKSPVRVTVQSSGGGKPAGGEPAQPQMAVRPLTAFTGNLYNTGGICAGCADLDADLSSNMLLMKDSTYPFLQLYNTSNSQKWQLWDFDTSGDLKFSDNALYPFSIEHATPSNTLYVAASGAVGIGTSTPSTFLNVKGLDIVGSPWPALRLFRTGGVGAWSLYAGSTWVSMIDEHVSSEPFMIQDGAPTYSFLISGTGKIGIGTSNPYYTLDVSGLLHTGAVYVGANAGLYTLDFLADTGANRNVFRAGINGYSNGFTVQYTNAPQAMVYSFINGNVGIGTGTPVYPLQMGSGAYCSAGGVWTNASSREYKQDVKDLPAEAAEETLGKLTPVTYAYRVAPDEHHVGFVAEDAPDLVTTTDHKGMSAMDVVAVLTKVVQEQQKTIAVLSAKVADLEKRR